MNKMITIAVAAVLMTACGDQQDLAGPSLDTPDYATVVATESQATVTISSGLEVFAPEAVLTSLTFHSKFNVSKVGVQTLGFPDKLGRAARRIVYTRTKNATQGYNAIVWVVDGRTWTVELNQLTGAGNTMNKRGTAIKACSVDLGCRAALLTW